MKRTKEQTRGLIEAALKEMLANDEKINVLTVAKRVRINHSYIHLDFPDLKMKIDAEKIKQQSERKKLTDAKLIERQKKQIKSFKNNQRNDCYRDDDFDAMLGKMVETYRMYDILMQENEDLKSRLIADNDVTKKDTTEVVNLRTKIKI
ncbi:hypothetical protein [Aliivibrio fischeri]|uniref:Uncharacterized protein n=1 Tax=Aliivibrio fischeri TaxID=668 RepID=A0A844P4B0_ALIFS|nr:hypothetical protein [Aliivibrio fischeri]MUK50772.1 hypothetical protein [Aliivibrio fischeri]